MPSETEISDLPEDYNENGDLLENKSRKMNGKTEKQMLLPSPVHSWFACRYILAFISFLGFINLYTLRVNLSEAIVAMVNKSDTVTNFSQSECPVPNDTIISQSNGEFHWSPSLQGTVLGSFFYGYICTQIISGYLAQRFGGKWILGCGILITALLTLLTPILTRLSVYLLIIVRVIEGFCEGVAFPCMHAIWSHWAPKLERSKLLTFTYAGAQLGTVISLLISGLLSSSSFLGGWPSVFYVFGVIAIMWFVLWAFLVFETPEKHPRITKEERDYIERSVGQPHRIDSVPWLSIAKSFPVWAIVVAHFCCNWGFYTMLTNLPKYMDNILHFNLKQNAFLSAVPYVLFFIFITTCGFIADFIRSHKYLSTKNTRKLLILIGFSLPAILMVAIGYTGCDVPLTTTLLILSVSCLGISFPGYLVNHMDIAPKYAGTLMGISNTFATIPGFVGPQVVGLLTEKHQTRSHWQMVFYIAAAINVFGIIFYCIFGDGEEQRWARDPDDGKQISKEI